MHFPDFCPFIKFLITNFKEVLAKSKKTCMLNILSYFFLFKLGHDYLIVDMDN